MNPILQCVFVFLCIEVAAIAILVAPWGASARRAIISAVSKSSALESLARPLKYFFVLVLLTWAFTTYEMMNLQREYPEMRLHHDLSVKLQHESRMARKQRDFYLVGFTALLLLVVSRLYQIFKEVNSLTANKEAMKKQADQAVAAFKSLQAENEELKKGASAKEPAASEKREAASAPAAAAAAGAEDLAELQSLQEENKALQSMLKKAEAERGAAEKSAIAIKKQAEGLSQEYARLTRDKESLQNKLDDFELLAGDAVKKSK